MRSHRILALLVLLCAASLLPAQDTAAITGTVRDNSGAVVPNADVKITNPAGGFDRATTTNSDGDYLAAGLPAATYNLSVSAKGFQTYQVKDVVLRVAQKLRVDAALQVGAVTTEVVVQGENVAQVETQSSELAGTVTGRQITQLELNGRNFTQLATMTPGVSNQTGNDEPGTGLGGNVQFSVNGGRVEYNNWEIDGGDNMDNGSNATLNTYPSLDAIAEFRVLTSNYGAQYGRNGSGTVEVETKSGTSHFHGDVYEFVRNDAFNARNFFQDRVPEYKKNDYGYTIGGPFYIPHVYNEDKSKTFFFWSQEWRKDVVPGINFNTPVPSLAERGGDFNELCPAPGTDFLQAPSDDPALASVPVFVDCPASGAGAQSGTLTGFPNNSVTVDPNAVPMLVMIPNPTNGQPGDFTFKASPAQHTNWRQELIRVDQNIGTKWRGSVRFIHDSWDTVNAVPLWTNGGSFPTVQTNETTPGVGLIARLTTVASPSLLNEFVFSYTTDHINLVNTGNVLRPSGYNIGLFQNGFGGNQLPGFSLNGGIFTGIAQDPGYIPQGVYNSNPVFTYRDNISKIVGKHNLQFGAYIVNAHKNEVSPQPGAPGGALNGFFTFDGTNSVVSTGNAFADMLIGRITAFGQQSVQPKYHNYYHILEPYLQDDWRVTPTLTLNLGLRLSLYGTYREKDHIAFNFDPAKFDPASAPAIDVDGSVTGFSGALIPGAGNPFNGIVQCGGPGGTATIPPSILALFPAATVGTAPDSCMEGHLWNPAPRIGFAWDPFGDGKTAIRGGYGVFWEHTNGNESNSESLENSPPLALAPVQNNIPSYSALGSGTSAFFPLGLIAIPTKAQWPYIQQWHLDVQHEFPWRFVGVLSYVGTKGTHLVREADINQIGSTPLDQNPFLPGEAIDCSLGTTPSGAAITGQAAINFAVACGADPNPFRPFLGHGDITRRENRASSTYHGLQLSARKVAGALQFSFAYTYSHAIDDGSDGLDPIIDTYHPRFNRGSSGFDVRHLLTASYVYDLPFFRGSGLAHTLLGGWEYSGIINYQSGSPFNVVSSVDNAGVANGTFGSTSYPDVIGDPNSNIPNAPSGTGFGPFQYNPAVFVEPRGLTFGNVGRNRLTNPHTTNFDMALFKHFPIHESIGLEFRAEAFNIFNHTQFGYLGGSSGSAGGVSAISSFTNTLGADGFLQPNAAHNARILQLGLKLIF